MGSVPLSRGSSPQATPKQHKITAQAAEVSERMESFSSLQNDRFVITAGQARSMNVGGTRRNQVAKARESAQTAMHQEGASVGTCGKQSSSAAMLMTLADRRR
jgi:hypothetical protein